MFTLILFSSLCLKALTRRSRAAAPKADLNSAAVCAQPFKLDHNVNSKRSDVIDWPQLLGEDNRPKPEHVVEGIRLFMSPYKLRADATRSL